MPSQANKISSQQLERQADVPSGNYLFHFRSNKPLSGLSVYEYRLRVAGGVEDYWDRDQFTATARWRLDREHGTPVASAGPLRVLSLTKLSQPVEAWGKTVEPELLESTELSASEPQQRAKLRNLLQSCLRRAIPESRYDFRFLNDITRREPQLSTGEGGFAGHPKYELKVQLTSDGIALLHAETGYSIRSESTLDEIYDRSDNPDGKKVAHHMGRYNVQGQGWLKGWSEYSYTDYIEDAGAKVADLHEGKADEEWRQRLIEEDPQLLSVDYGGGPRNQAPHFLTLAPTLDQVQQQDPEFFSQFSSRKAMMPDERFTLAKKFVETLSTLPIIDIEFETTPTNYGYERVRIRDQTHRLIFGGGNRSAHASHGLRDYGVFQSPGQYRVGILVPERFETLAKEFPPILLRGLNQLDAPGRITTYSYELGDVSNYTPVYQDIADDTDVVVAVVPDEEVADDFPGLDDPHSELKRTLMRQGIPTQMLQKSTTQDLVKVNASPGNESLLNILSAIIAKAGGTPWQIKDLPGETDAFMGLDVTRDTDTNQHAGASASVVLSDGTTFAAESVTQQAGEKFEAKHVQQFVRDLIFDFADSHGKDIGRLCIMRDGKVEEDIESIEHDLSQLDTEIDIVGIRKSGQPRVAKFNGTRFRIAQKGIGFVDEARNQAILHSFGTPEANQDNSVGTPRTFRLTKHTGPTDTETLARQAYWLSEVHMGSPSRSPRLPIPIDYADMAAEYVREGYASPGEVITGPAYI